MPQGSVLGGLLHIINSNDFPACHEEGEAIVYVDDDSDTVHSADPVILRNLIEQEAENSAQWLSDNRLCVAGEKSKLLIIGTRQLKNQKLTNKLMITVDGKDIIETDSEKLLGVVINGELTWKNHLYGDEEHEGLIPQLSKRAGILKKLSTKMSKERLKLFSSGIFYSKLSYCLPVFGNVLGLEMYKEENSRYTSFTSGDNNKLQVLQNKVNRMLTDADKRTPTSGLLERTDSLSNQQMIAFQTMVMMQKILVNKKPSYLANKIQKSIIDERQFRGRDRSLSNPRLSLSIAREGFVRRGTTLMNMLDVRVRSQPTISQFKSSLRELVKTNINIKPVSKFPNLSRGGRARAAPAATTPRRPAGPAQNLITQYFN